LYLTLVRPQLENASTIWNYVTSTDAKKLVRTQRTFVALCQNCFFTNDHVTYEDFLQFLKLHTLHDRRLRLDALCFLPIYSGLQCCPSLLVFWYSGIRVLPRNFRNSSPFTDTCENSPSARCVSAANRVCKDIDNLGNPLVL
jgi:hypothetical protein